MDKSIYVKLFNLAKQNLWDDFKKIIIENKELDLNIRDDNNNYLINFIILNNKYDILEIFLERKCKIDLVDSDNRSILYIPLKYDYYEIINLLLKHESMIVGISNTDIRDNNGYYAIHYAIFFKNLKILKLFKKYGKSFNKFDSENNTLLHLGIKSNSLEIFNFILENTSDYENLNIYGENQFRFTVNYKNFEFLKILYKKNININNQDFKNEITPIMYTIILDDIEIFNFLLDKSDLNLQDNLGNNIMHYVIIYNKYNYINTIIDFLKNNNNLLNLDNTNMFGKTPLHLLLDKLLINKKLLDIFDINYFIQNTNINLQDNTGSTIFLMLCQNNLWIKFYDTLINKKINYNIYNLNKENALYFIQDDLKDKFYNLITHSYLNQIRKKDKNYTDNFYNICKKKISYIKKDDLKDYINDTTLKKSDRDICFDILKNLIIQKKIQYPTKLRTYCLEIEEFKKLEKLNLYYTGSRIDILFGLIYLLKEYNISTSISKNFYINDEIKNHYLDFKNIKLNNDFLNFEIIWDGQKIFYPNNLEEQIDTFKSDKNKNFYIIPIGIELHDKAHANILIYDKQNNSMERFEPHGNTYPRNFNYFPNRLDNLLKNHFSYIFSKLNYVNIKNILPKIGFQTLELLEHSKNKQIGDPGGFCAVWCIWYTFNRIKYKEIKNTKLANKLIQKFTMNNISFKNIIRNFSKEIIFIRDQILIKSELNIDTWINTSYEYSKYLDLVDNISNYINTLSNKNSI